MSLDSMRKHKPKKAGSDDDARRTAAHRGVSRSSPSAARVAAAVTIRYGGRIVSADAVRVG